MNDLKEHLSRLNLNRIRTYIQSGNVIFESPEQHADFLKSEINACIYDNFKLHVPVIIRTLAELRKIKESNPFLSQEIINKDKLHVTFLNSLPHNEKTKTLQKPDNITDEFIISGKEIYLYCPEGYGKTKLNNNFFENKLDVTATTRNWKTVNKLVELATG